MTIKRNKQEKTQDHIFLELRLLLNTVCVSMYRRIVLEVEAALLCTACVLPV